MALAPLFFLALLGAAAYAAVSSSSSSSGPPSPTSDLPPVDPPLSPPLDARARIPEQRAPDTCSTSATAIGLLDSSALIRWVSCENRTAAEVAELLVRLEQQARAYPAGGYGATAANIRRAWNDRLDTEDAQVNEPRSAPASRPSRAQPARTQQRTQPSGRGAQSSELERELVRADREHPGARARFNQAMNDASPSELRAAADAIEDMDRSYVVIPRTLRAKAATRGQS